MRTKIVATIGPASENEDVLRQMIRAGMSVARLNFSHGSHDDHKRRLELVRRMAREENAYVAVMGDLQGPKFRVGNLPKEGVKLINGEVISLSCSAKLAADQIPLPHPELIHAMQPGMRVLIDDGVLMLRVVDVGSDVARCIVTAGGTLLPRKGVSLPGSKISVSSMSDKDREDLKFMLQIGIDAVALSFVRTADDLRELRALINVYVPNKADQPLVVAKIEKPEAVTDLAAILKVTDVVMVARGDLGVEALPQEVPFYQKRIIRACGRAGIPVITATQMLQSMVESPTPTRAEATDVANAVLDGTDAVMLSAETATGTYPVEAIQMMQAIATHAEREEDKVAAKDRRKWRLKKVDSLNVSGPDEVTEAITHAAVDVAGDVKAAAIVCMTHSGLSARMISRHRPSVPIIALAAAQRAYKYSAFIWDAKPISVEFMGDVDQAFENAARIVKENGFAKSGDRIVIVSGVPLGRGVGTTNICKVQPVI
ncbi:MAG: pyruvate kinase [Anaerolineae bacterium]|nr:pyruvate kinase [Anaerolineae bacterium]